jgi:exopolysaccharide production protein ExoQ
MSTASMRSVRLSKAAPTFDKCLIAPILAYAYCFIVSPMLMFEFPVKDTESQVPNQVFWPLVTGIALGCFASRNRSRLTWPPHIIWLAAYLALAGASILWAFKPEFSITRFATQTMMLISIVLPAMVAGRTSDLMRGVFFCFVFGSVLNAVLIIGGYSTIVGAGTDDAGYPGYLAGKNALGQFAAFAILLSLYKIFHPGWQRALGLIVVVTGTYLIFAAHSKAALGCVVIAAILAKLVLFIGKKMRVSPLIVLLPVPICYAILSRTVGNLVDRISWHIFHNYDLSGRTVIWDFVNREIAKRPLLGWGYRSFWLVGPDSPPLSDDKGWVGVMPEAHNGYLDTILDTGHIGLVLFLVFIFTTLYAIGRGANRDPARAWLLLSIALFVILVNFLESGWMRGGEPLWLMFVLVAVESGRYRQPFPRDFGAPGGSPEASHCGTAPGSCQSGGAGRLPRRLGQLHMTRRLKIEGRRRRHAQAPARCPTCVDTCRRWTGCAAWPS